MWICGAWVYVAGQSTSAMNISLIYASSPVMIAVGSVLWLGEHFTKRQILGVALSVAGVMHVLVRGHWSALAQVELVVGDLWILAAAIAWAAYALLQKHWHSPLSATARLATICMGGIVVLLPFTIWELSLSATPELGQQAYFLIGLTALVPGLGAYWIYGWTQRILGTSRVAVTLYLGPLYAGLAAWLLLNEPLGWHHLAGGLLILSGVGLVMATQKKSELGHAE